MADERSLRVTKMIRRISLGTPRNTRGFKVINEVAQEEKEECGQELLRSSSLLTWPSLHETFMELHTVQGVSGYSVFTFASLCTSHVEMSKLVKKFTMRN